MDSWLGVIVLGLLVGYLAGSVPVAVPLARLTRGVEVGRVGTRNPGAANVFREVGKGLGVVAATLDFSKGAVPVLLVGRVFGLDALGGSAAAVGAVVGHQLPLFRRFRGGAGLATAMGAVGGLVPVPFFLSALIAAPMLVVTRNAGRSGGVILSASVGIQLAGGWLGKAGVSGPWEGWSPEVAFGALLPALVLWARLLIVGRLTRESSR